MVTKRTVKGHVYADHRKAKYATWLETIFNRPYFRPMFAKWFPKIKARYTARFKQEL